MLVRRRRVAGTMADRRHFLEIEPEMRHEETTLEWWFVGSLIVLAIPVLAIAYTLWDAYRVTMR